MTSHWRNRVYPHYDDSSRQHDLKKLQESQFIFVHIYMALVTFF